MRARHRIRNPTHVLNYESNLKTELKFKFLVDTSRKLTWITYLTRRGSREFTRYRFSFWWNHFTWVLVRFVHDSTTRSVHVNLRKFTCVAYLTLKCHVPYSTWLAWIHVNSRELHIWFTLIKVKTRIRRCCVTWTHVRCALHELLRAVRTTSIFIWMESRYGRFTWIHVRFAHVSTPPPLHVTLRELKCVAHLVHVNSLDSNFHLKGKLGIANIASHELTRYYACLTWTYVTSTLI